jgi:hypothetical protein
VLKVGNEPLAAPQKKLDLNVEEDRKEAIIKTKEEMAAMKGKVMSAKIMYIRRMAAKILKAARRSTYFQENNHADAIATMMSSGLGRVGRRMLAKKLMITWKDYTASEEVIIAGGEYEISKGCATGLGHKNAWYESKGWTDIRDVTKFRDKSKWDIITHWDQKFSNVLIVKEDRKHSKLKKNTFIAPSHVFNENQICMVRKAK